MSPKSAVRAAARLPRAAARFPFLRAGLGAAISAAVGAAVAQTAAPATLKPVVITGNPLRSSDITAPTSVLEGDALTLRRGSTLGETLDGLPGVSSSWFGPNANRPVIRGQDGDRIRVLSNAGASLDASSLSNDHAVPIDPLVVERVEVLRGPAALLYGGSAIGGVVNAIDNRIPRRAVGQPTGAVDLRGGGAAAERGASGLVEAGSLPANGAPGIALHADAFWRETSDLRVPAYDRPGDEGPERADRVLNSASRADGGALGGSLVWGSGHRGASVDTYRNLYGTVAEEDVTIRMRRDRIAIAGEQRDLAGPIVAVRGQLAHTDYEHQEFEGSAVGTTFKNRGWDGRFEAEHAAVSLGDAARLRGSFGVPGEDARVSALGEEAFVPASHTEQVAGFVYEELKQGAATMTFGARIERTRVRSDGDAADAEEARFGDAQSRRFTAKSAALGGLYDLDPRWQLSANLAYTERAPTFYELYANGVHVATAAYERGDAALAKERGSNLDVALRWQDGPNLLKLGAYAGRYSNYIALLNTGEQAEGESGALPVYAFSGVPARLHGIELEGQWRLLDAASRVDVDGKLDLTCAERRDTGEPLPRIAPLRATVGLDWSQGAWSARGEVVHAARQSRVPADDEATAGYTLLNLSASLKLPMGPADGLLYAKLTNVTDRLAYNASTISTVRGLSPLPGRGAMVGLRVAF